MLRSNHRGGSTTLPTSNATPRTRRLAASRRAYDLRRRSWPMDPDEATALRWYADLVRGDPCSYCGDFCGDMAADHIVPLDQGGENRWTNLTAAGRRCNASKKAKPLLLWLAERPVPTG